MHEAKTNFSALIKDVQAGEEVIIAKAGVPVAKIVPIKPGTGKREFGYDKGLVWIAPDFDQYIPEEFEEYL